MTAQEAMALVLATEQGTPGEQHMAEMEVERQAVQVAHALAAEVGRLREALHMRFQTHLMGRNCPGTCGEVADELLEWADKPGQ